LNILTYKQGVQQLKDQAFPARFIFVAPPDLTELEGRLKQRDSMTEEMTLQRIGTAKQEIERSQILGFHDKILINDDLDTAYTDLENYIFGTGSNVDQIGTESLKEEAEAEAEAEAPTVIDKVLEMTNGVTELEEPLKAETSSVVEGEATGKILTADITSE
jgi:THO complex subunit 1